MNHFTPVSALHGGLLIGTAQVFAAVAERKQRGISNITAGCCPGRRGDVLGDVVLGGLVEDPRLISRFVSASCKSELYRWCWLWWGGCASARRWPPAAPSGPRRCGLGRLSVRLTGATVIFLVVGIVTNICRAPRVRNFIEASSRGHVAASS